MTNPQNSGQEPEPHTNARRSRLVLISSAVGSILLVGLAAGGWWVWRFVHNELAPLVAANLSELLDRPVEVGPVEGISFTSLRFGESTVPPTETDPDRLTIPAITVQFNPLQAIFDRTLGLDVTLEQPTIYLEQDEDGLWISSRIQEREDTDAIVEIELERLRIQQGVLELAPYVEPVADTTEVEIPPQVGIVPETEERPDSETEATASEIPITPIIAIRDVDADVTFRENNQLISFDLTGLPETGGNLNLSGRADLQEREVNLQVNSADLLAADIGFLLPLPLRLRAGLLDTALNVQFPILQGEGETPQDAAAPTEAANNAFLSQLFLNGTVDFRNAVARLDALPQPFTQANGRIQFRGQQLTFQNTQGRYGEIDARVGGGLHLLNGYNINVGVPEVTAANLLSTFDVEPETLPVELDGVFRSELDVTGAIEAPVVNVFAENIDLVQIDRILFSTAATQFTITPEAIVFNDIQASPLDGGFISGTGSVQFGDAGGLVFDLQGDNLPGDAIAQAYGFQQPEIVIGNVDVTAQVFGSLGDVGAIQTLAQWQAPQATYPGRGQVAIAGDTIRFQDTVLLVAGGIVRGEGLISQGQWQATVDGSGVELSQFSPELRGLFSGQFQLAGTLEDLSPAGIQAEGEVTLSEGLAIITDPLTASVRWLGNGIQILRANAPGFDADGFVGVVLAGADAPGISNFDLNVQLRDYGLAELPVQTPGAVQLAGAIDFAGRITGTPASPNVAGQVGLYDFALNQFAFEPILTGSVQFDDRGLDLDLAGTQDRIAVVLDAQNRPVSFFVQQGDAIAEGRGEGDRLLATLTNFPLAALNLAPAAEFGLGAVGGRLDGSFNANITDLANPSVVGEFVVREPSLDYITADLISGRFRYIDGIGVLEDGQLQRGGSTYLLAGNFNPGAEPQLQGTITAAPGRIEDIFDALQWFQLADLARGLRPPVFGLASDVLPFEVGISDRTLINQLRRYSEIRALYGQQVAAREAAMILPELATLQGAFAGDINIAYSAQTGAQFDFDLRGQDWVWGEYQVEQILALGSFENSILTLRPLLLQSGESLARFTGQVGGEQQSGQLIAQNLPVEPIQELVRLPIAVEEGVLNANAFLTGSVGNPQLIGEILLDDLVVNNVEAPPLRTLFGYSDARLNVESRVRDEPPEAIAQTPIDTVDTADTVDATASILQFTASIPYSLPFMTVMPDSNDFSLDLNIRNDGLALVTLFTDQVAWGGGEGDVQLQARGTLDTTETQPRIATLSTTGQAVLNDARFSAQALPEDITNVSGNILFGGDRIRVETLQGQFSDGQLVAQGTLPLLVPLDPRNPDEEAPLTLSLQNVALELDNLYDGGVNGQVVLRGSALAPVIGGDIILQNGQIFIPDAADAGTVEAAVPVAFEPGLVSPPELEDLRVVLGDRLRVTSPLLNFLINGELFISGTPDDLRPDGTVFIRSGQVNLFTTQFFLDRDYQNVADFSPERGFDPYLDVQMVASVPEITRAPIAQVSPLTTAEIAETPAWEYGALQTIRVEASVMGLASQIYSNLELTSTPRRSESELVALLGGNFASTLGGGGALALANIAGATLLTGLQNLISDATGLTDFRLFPTNVLSENERTSTLALGAEVGFDLTRDLSVSILQLLTVEEPTRFNVRYRLNDEFTLRGSTNTRGDGQAVLEFETRF
jgi:translocation and assembly module TamB